MSYWILHIADPHFDRSHYPNVGARDAARHHADEIASALQNSKPFWGGWRRKFDAAIFSGDFSLAGHSDQFDAAVEFVDRVAELVVDGRVLVIPGNHDIALNRPLVISNLALPTPKEEAEARFREFAARIDKHVGPPPNSRLSMVLRSQRRGEKRGLVLIGLNSCRVDRRDAHGWGYVGADQLFEVANLLLEPSAAQRGDIVIAVSHHNPLPIWDIGLEGAADTKEHRKFSFMMDAGTALNSLADLGVSVFLHAHTHVDSAKVVEGYGSGQRKVRPMLVLGGASSCLAGTHKDAHNHFQVIEINEDNLYNWDFEATAGPLNQKRAWTQAKLPFFRPIITFWDPDHARESVERMKRPAEEAALDEEYAQSWAQLRTRLDSQRWDHVVRQIHLRVKELECDVSEASVRDFLESLFDAPPEDNVISEWRLEQYVARALCGDE